jgi:hypothetical protein
MLRITKDNAKEFSSVISKWANDPNAVIQVKHNNSNFWFEVKDNIDFGAIHAIRVKPVAHFRAFDPIKDNVLSLVGKKIHHIRDVKRSYVITHVNNEEVLLDSGVNMQYKTLLNFTISGTDKKPCGVWVEGE